jgi:NAD(P)H-hydrate epimerase
LKRLGLVAGAKTNPAWGRPDLIIDAILGYGFHGKPRRRTARWIEWANSQGCPILALDLPSGLDATTGIPSTPCIRATATLTLALPKTGLRAPQAQAFVGEVFLADIGVPPEVYRDIGLEVRALFAGGSIIRLDDTQER